MATVSEVSELDSGVASPEATPEGQVPLIKKAAGSTSSASDKCTNSNSKEAKYSDSNSIFERKDKSLSVFSQEAGINSDDGDDDGIDESLAERLWGLTEMFPNSVRSVASSLTRKTVSIINGTYQLSRQIVWIGVSTSLVLFAPVMFEVERFNVEEMVKQDRNRLVLGPGSAMSGPPSTPGLAPPPTR